MKKILLLATMLLAVSGINAQTQKGYVKTKGRLANNGKVIKGTMLPGATVMIKDRNAVVSGKEGTFSLAIAGKYFYLLSVQKRGYILCDPDILSRQYAFSPNPLIISMETPSQQADDRLAAERSIRRTLQRQLQEKEAEIEAMKAQNQMTEEAYRQQLQQLYAQQESNEKLISDMADRYSHIDFDEIDEFNRRISCMILEGKLTEADSLINSKGDINARATELRQRQKANVQEEQELNRKKKNLEMRKELTQKVLEDLAQDCYSKYEIFKMKHLNDSAAYYINLRSELDTTNVEWTLESGAFALNYKADIELTEKLYKRALNIALSIGNDKDVIASCYNDYSELYAALGDFQKGLEYTEKALTLHKELFGENHQSVATNYSNAGFFYAQLGNLAKAVECFETSLAIQKNVLGEKHADTANTYNNLGMVCYIKGDNDRAIDYMLKALEIFTETSDLESFAVASTYNNLSSAYLNKKDHEQAINYAEKALKIRRILGGEKHPMVALSYMNIGGIYKEQGKYEDALIYFKQALNTYIEIFGNDSEDVAYCLNNIGSVYGNLHDYEKGIENLKKALDIRIKLHGNKHMSVATCYNNLGYLYDAKGDKEKALDYYFLSLEIRKSVYGDCHRLISATYANIASVYEDLGMSEKALEYYREAEKATPPNDDTIKKIKNKIKELQEKIQ